MTYTTVDLSTAWWGLRQRLRGDRGEGVISAAIAVLIVAFIGAAMWVAFNSMWRNSETRIKTNVEQIGGPANGG
jgi:hypothetical protein